MPQEQFKQVLKAAGAELRRLAFQFSGSTARIKRGENVGVINFQKSNGNTKCEVKFTINLGVWSQFLDQFAPSPTPATVSEMECHWRARIGQFLPGGQDHWWKITSGQSTSDLETTIVRVVRDVAAPAILDRVTDEGLARACANGLSFRLWYDLALLRRFGPASVYATRLAEEHCRVSESARPHFEQILRDIEKIPQHP
jgi:hypothetical protein